MLFRKRKGVEVVKRISSAVLVLSMMLGSFSSDIAYAGTSGSTSAKPGATPSTEYSKNVDSGYNITPYSVGYLSITPIYSKEKGEVKKEIITSADYYKIADATCDHSTFTQEMYINEELAATFMPTQNISSLLMVPEASWGKGGVAYRHGHNDDWPDNITAVYVNEKDTGLTQSDGSTGMKYDTSLATRNNIFYMENTRSENKFSSTTPTISGQSDFDAIAKTGVFRGSIKNAAKNTDQKKSAVTNNAYKYDFSVLANEDYSTQEKLIKDIIQDAYNTYGKDNIVKKAKQVWTYIARYEDSDGYIKSDVGARAERFEVAAYNADISAESGTTGALNKNEVYVVKKSDYDKDGTKTAQAVSAYNASNSSGLEIPLDKHSNPDFTTRFSELGFKYTNDSTKAEETGYNPEYAYANNLYSIGFLDLLLCGYAVADSQGGAAAKYWLEAATCYISQKEGIDSGVRLSVQPGTIVMGLTETGTGEKDEKLVFSTVQDAINRRYKLSTAGMKETGSVSDSVSKPYIGTYYGKKNNYTNFITDWKSSGDDITYTKGRNKEIKVANGKDLVALPSYYKDYYSRLEAAIKESDPGSLGKNGFSWYGYAALKNCLKYSYSTSGGEVKKETYSDTESKVELLRAMNITAAQKSSMPSFNSSQGIGVEDMENLYGAGLLCGHSIQPTVTPDFDFVAKLEIHSDLAASTYKKDSKHETSDGVLWQKVSSDKESTNYYSTAYLKGSRPGDFDSSALLLKGKTAWLRSDDAVNYTDLLYVDIDSKSEALNTDKYTTRDKIYLKLSLLSMDNFQTKDNTEFSGYTDIKSFLSNNAKNKSDVKLYVEWTTTEYIYTGMHEKNAKEPDGALSTLDDDTTSATKFVKTAKTYQVGSTSALEKYFSGDVPLIIDGEDKGFEKKQQYSDKGVKIDDADTADLYGPQITYNAKVVLEYIDNEGKTQTIEANTNGVMLDYSSKIDPDKAGLNSPKLEIYSKNATRSADKWDGVKESDGYVLPDYESGIKDSKGNRFLDGATGSEITEANSKYVAQAGYLDSDTNGNVTDTIGLRLRTHYLQGESVYSSFSDVCDNDVKPKTDITFYVSYEMKYNSSSSKNATAPKADEIFGDDVITQFKKGFSVSKDKAIKILDKGTPIMEDSAKLALSLPKGVTLSYRAKVRVSYTNKKGKVVSLDTASSNWVQITATDAVDPTDWNIAAKLEVQSTLADSSKRTSGVAGSDGYSGPDYSTITDKSNKFNSGGETWGTKGAHTNGNQAATTANGGVYAMDEGGTVNDSIKLRLRIQSYPTQKTNDKNYASFAKWVETNHIDKSTLKIKVTYSSKSKGVTLTSSNSTFIKGGASLFTDSSTINYADLKAMANKSTSESTKKAVAEKTDSLLKSSGFKVKSGGTVIVGYQAKVTITAQTTSGDKKTISTTSNIATVQYGADSKTYPHPYGRVTTNGDPNGGAGSGDYLNPSKNYVPDMTEAYAELKEGSIYNETFEAMAGVPSTRTLYLSIGGSEFIVNLQAEYAGDNHITRTYHSIFAGTDCEYKAGDSLKGLAAGQTKSETFKADKNDATTSASVTAEANNIVTPTGASSSNTTTSGHDSQTVIKAQWTGTIANATSKPSEDTFDPGKAGSPCEGDGYKVGNGATGVVKNATTNWSVSDYNTALSNAISWAKEMESISDSANGSAWRIADSDGTKRIYHVGTAVIKIELTGGGKTYAIECGDSKNDTISGKYTSSSASGAKLKSSDSSILGSGWSYSHGTNATGSYSNNTCNDVDGKCTIKNDSFTLHSQEEHTHGGQGSACYPKIGTTGGKNPQPIYATTPQCGKTEHTHKSKPSKTQSGNACWEGSGHEHTHTHSFTPGVKWTDGASNAWSYTITVTFKDGTTTAKNYDGDGTVATSTETVGTALPAHALCGPCCQHVLKSVEDKWQQELYYDTLRITNLRIWKLDSGYAEGMTEIQKGTGYTGDEYDVVVSNITQSDPNFFYNIARQNNFGCEESSSLSGRVIFTVQTGQGDNVEWQEHVTATNARSPKCDGTSKTISDANPAKVAATGHEKKWCRGILYTNNTATVSKVDSEKIEANGADELATKRHADEYVDKYDKASVEWKTFKMRRTMKINAIAVSDFVILHTTSGDQSIMYYTDAITVDKKGAQCTTEHDFGTNLCYHDHTKCASLQEDFEEDFYDHVDYKNGWARMWTNNPYVNPYLKVNNGSYNGNYALTDYTTYNKYTGEGREGGTDTILTTIYDDAGTFNNPQTGQVENTINAYNVNDTGRITQSAYSYSIGAATTSTKGGFTTGATSKYYTSAALRQHSLGHVTTPLIITQDGIAQNPTNQNKEYVTGQSYAFWEMIFSYDTNMDYKGNILNEGDVNWGYIYPTTAQEDTVLDAYDTKKTAHYGYRKEAIYTDGQTKVNNIVVQNPVSVEGAMIVSQDSDLDQRVDGKDLSAEANKNLGSKNATCPGTPAECDYAAIFCDYGKAVDKAAFKIDDFARYVRAGYEEAVDDKPEYYDYYIVNSVKNTYGVNAESIVTGTGFEIFLDDNGNYCLKGGASGSLNINAAVLDIDADYLCEKYTLSATVTTSGSEEKAIFAFGDAVVTAKDGYINLYIKNGKTYTSSSAVISNGTPARIALSICPGDVDNVTVSVNDIKVSLKESGSNPLSISIGNGVYIGNSNNTSFSTQDILIDNIAVRREAGSTSHLAICGTDGEDCTEPHHIGGHYNKDNHICWKACSEYLSSEESIKNHSGDGVRQISSTTDKNGNNVSMGSFIFLDNFFQVYYPSKGYFYESDAHGIENTQQTKGMGYGSLNVGISTAEWVREKYVKFPYSVLFNRNGTWEEHEADEWIALPVFDDSGNEIEYYDFYCQLRNDELQNGIVQYFTEAINNSPYPESDTYTTGEEWRSYLNTVDTLPYAKGRTNTDKGKIYYNKKMLAKASGTASCTKVYKNDYTANTDVPFENGYQTNKLRASDLTAHHTAYKMQYIDVVGRIGNLIVEDTDDVRFSTTFKKVAKDGGWQIDNLIEAVEIDNPQGYFAWMTNDGDYELDVRGEKVSSANEYYNTYSSQTWTDLGSVINEKHANKMLSLPVSASKNTVSALTETELRNGYGLLWDITTIGSYAQGNLQVLPYFYVLDTKTDTLTPVDVYKGAEGSEQPVNYFGLFENMYNEDGTINSEYQALVDTVAEQSMILDWDDECNRRNYSAEEKARTEYVRSSMLVEVTDADGNTVTVDTTVVTADGTTMTLPIPVTKTLITPYGTYHRIGNLQLIYAGQRTRTFVGGSRVPTLQNKINGSNDQSLKADKSDAGDYYARAQRWHQTLGTPDAPTFVAYRNNTHVNPKDTITYADGTSGEARLEFAEEGRYVVLMAADITAFGYVYDLHYSTGSNNGSFIAGGKTYKFASDGTFTADGVKIDSGLGKMPTLLAVYSSTDTTMEDYDIIQTH